MSCVTYSLPKRPLLFHPAIVYSCVWGLVSFLYSLHLSNLLLFSTADALTLSLLVVIPFLVAYGSVAFMIGEVLPSKSQTGTLKIKPDQPLETLDRRLRLAFRIWIGLTIVEIIASGGLPIVWAVTGSSKTYFDFGIPSIHGLMNSILLSISLIRYGLALRFGRRRDYGYLIFNLVWAIICITRQMIIVVIIEGAIIYFFHRRVRPARIVGGVSGVILLVLAFGVIGDLRSGAEAFRMLAQPTAAFPTWAPSGLLWVYIYIATPINNLLNTTHYGQPLYDPLLPNTAAMLFPSIIRQIVYKTSATDAISGNLVAEAFNASTAFVGPFQDFGAAGIAAVSAFYGMLSTIYWHKVSFRSVLIYTVLAQCLTLTIFYNHFFYLPIIFQIVWIYVFFLGSNGNPVPVTPNRISMPA